MPAVRVEDLEKTYTSTALLPWNKSSETVALDRVSFAVGEGEVFGVVGPNGAGKSTLINILSGLLYKDSGVVEVFGEDFEANRERLTERMNVATAYSMLSSRLTVRENLEVFARLYGVDERAAKIDEVLDLFEIADLGGKRIGHLSAGQKTRANLCKAFVNDPDLLLLDEATAGLDPHIAGVTRDAIRAMNTDRGTTLIITSHDMRDIDELCDRMLFLHEGNVLRTGTPHELKRDIHVKVLRVEVEEVTDAFRTVVADAGGEVEGTTARINVEEEAHIVDILDAVGGTDTTIVDIEAVNPDLDELFDRVARGAL